MIDTGLVREVRQDRRNSTSRLVLDWCSRASTKQRAGRAGRVRAGVCCKLFSSRTASLLRKQTIPELQRVPLEEVCLSVLAGKLATNCMEFLRQAPEPPSEESVRVALQVLTEVGALQIGRGGADTLSPLGEHLAKLPVHPRLGKMLLYGSLFRTIHPILSVVATLSTKSPFVTAVDNAREAKARHKAFQHESSDFLTMTNVWDAFTQEGSVTGDRGRKFCRRNVLSWTTLMEIGDLRRQLLELLGQIGFVDRTLREDDVERSRYNTCGRNEQIVHAVICAGLFPNVAQAVKEGSIISSPPALWHRRERLYFRNSSVNHNKTMMKLGSDWILFHEKFATGRTTVSVTSPVNPVALVLFGNDVVVKHLERTVTVDEWMDLPMPAQTGVSLRQQRDRLGGLLRQRLQTGHNDQMTVGMNKSSGPDTNDKEESEETIVGIVSELLCP